MKLQYRIQYEIAEEKDAKRKWKTCNMNITFVKKISQIRKPHLFLFCMLWTKYQQLQSDRKLKEYTICSYSKANIFRSTKRGQFNMDALLNMSSQNPNILACPIFWMAALTHHYFLLMQITKHGFLNPSTIILSLERNFFFV